MKIPPRIIDIINTLYSQHVDLAEGSDEERRKLTQMMCEQTCYEFGNEYGMKKASMTRPPGKDSVAYFPHNQYILWAYDWQNGATRKPHDPPGQFREMSSSQVFLPVTPVNHLGDTPPEPSEPEPCPKIPYNEAYSVEFGKGCNEVYNEVGYDKIDPGMISVQSQRAAWDYYVGEMTWPESYKKHINELRAVYGLPPI